MKGWWNFSDHLWEKHLIEIRFYPSKAKQIAERIISEELNGTVYEEEDAKNWSLNISDKVREAVCGQCIVSFTLHSLFYSIKLESLGKSRFKIVVQTTIGQLRDQGIRIASRCLWDPNTDNYASVKYSNVRDYSFTLSWSVLKSISSLVISVNLVLQLSNIRTVHRLRGDRGWSAGLSLSLGVLYTLFYSFVCI